MGSSTSKNQSTNEVLQKNLTQSINTSLTKIAQTCISNVSATQRINIVGLSAGGSVTIGNVTQKLVARVDTKKFTTAVDSKTLANIMANALDYAEKTDQKVNGGMGGGNTENSTTSSIRNEKETQILNSYSYDQFTNDVNSILTAQEINLGNIGAGANITIDNISQYVQVEILSNQIAKAMTETFARVASSEENKVQKEATATTTSGVTGGDLTKIFGMIFVVLLIVGAIVLYIKFGGMIGGSRSAGALARAVHEQQRYDDPYGARM